MNRKRAAALGVSIIIICVTAFTVWNLLTSIPDALPEGQNPELMLPLYDYSHLDVIQAYGQIRPDYFHPGFDFGVNDTTVIVAPCDAYVTYINSWYNDKSGHWQTNVGLRLNSKWRIDIVFESWAENETYGALQFQAIIVRVGQFVAANQTIGNLLCHGSYAHIHFGLYFNEEAVCPYPYFTPSAQSTFQELYMKVGQPAGDWCIIP
ncbi:MAG: M23 family metallopeptidase [Candidatus Odinarchaeum yellowstonii]|uniref:M23 family metallopeptidase n=1 Tax=Odinarchaeota yellowstonii (strain LCB_4) TaxID=1841599 RepID=A0AAF0D388_ODILC|nr:MAG: M23 family metallopeptidase [Candidatus Odinarchaeum yellowstonii]